MHPYQTCPREIPRLEGILNEETKYEARSHMVVVVGIDLSDVSEHLLARARDLVRPVDNAELHIVHVVPQPLLRLVEPARPTGLSTRAQIEFANQELQRLSGSVVRESRARVVVHTPVGRIADELTRIAREVAADLIVVEVYEHAGLRRVFHHSVVSRIARTAPCSVLAIRDPARAVSKPQVTDPDIVAGRPLSVAQ
jgi:nucleotide-binding universal stress UspA family protein